MFRKLFFTLSVLSLFVLSSGKAFAQSLEFIRDAEIENTIRTYATPLFEQAGVNPDAVQIHIIKDNQINAFVAEGLNLFLYTGLLIKTQNASQLIGVIAHESGHIAGGHLVRGTDARAAATTEALASMLVGLAAGLAARSGEAGMAAMQAGNEMAERSYLAFSRGIEASADTAALGFLDNLHMSSKGFLDFMELLGDQDLLMSAQQDPYVRTHPLTRDRVEEIRHHVETSQWTNVPVPPEYVEMHRRMRAKLIAFFDPPVSTLARYKEGDNAIEARYARAIAYYRMPDLAHAIPLIDGLIAERPKDPYFHELKGQMLFENARGNEAIPEYKLAVKYLPDNALLRAELGQVELESEDQAMLADAKTNLKFAVQRAPEDIDTWRMLATAYGKSGDEIMAETALAEYALLAGRWSEAIYHAGKADKSLPKGSPAELRMSDIISQAQLARDKEKSQR